jgi:hypothetical protein
VVIRPVMDDNPLMDDSPLMELRPLMDDSPLMELSPLIDDSPLMELRPLIEERASSWLPVSTLLAYSPQPIKPTMAPSAILIWMVRFPSSFIWIPPLRQPGRLRESRWLCVARSLGVCRLFTRCRSDTRNLQSSNQANVYFMRRGQSLGLLVGNGSPGCCSDDNRTAVS